MYLDIPAGQKPWPDVYRLCIGFINPRPIALVSTRSPAGALNLAPYSFYNMISGNPPVVMFSPTLRRTGAQKDTLANVLAAREFVIATVTAEIADRMVRCAADLPAGRSEFEFSGLTPAPATRVAASLVRESPVNLECRLRQTVQVGEGPGSATVVFGDIVALHLDDAVLDDRGRVDPRKLATVGRLGGAWYANVDAPYELEIPEVSE